MSLAETLDDLLDLHEKSLELDKAAHAAAVVAGAAHDEYLHALAQAIGERQLLIERLRKARDRDFFARKTPRPPPMPAPPPPGMKPAHRLTPPTRTRK